MADGGDTGHDQSYLRLLRRVLIRIGGLSRDLVEPLGLTPPQALALVIIQARKSMTQVSLVKALDSDPNTVSGIVRRLETRGLVTRVRGNSDGRSITLSVTDEGAVLADRAQAAFDRLAAALNDTVPKRSAGTISEWLRAILAIDHLLPD